VDFSGLHQFEDCLVPCLGVVTRGLEVCVYLDAAVRGELLNLPNEFGQLGCPGLASAAGRGNG
jgi:hypothetical protein